MSMSDRMPSAFIPHGAGPCFFMDWDPPHAWDGLAAYLRGIPAALPEKPKAILLVSAHWQTDGFRVGSNPHPELIYDYYNFPAHTYQISYPAPGNPVLAGWITKLLHEAGLPVQEDPIRGYDHGVFIPLKMAFPEADVPVVTLSLDRNAGAAALLAGGRALAPLRDHGVLILGSGMSFHNMRAFGNPRYQPSSEAFDAWLTETVENPDAQARQAALTGWAETPFAHDCHPVGGEEHFLPLLVVAGAGMADKGARRYSEATGGFRVSAFHFG